MSNTYDLISTTVLSTSAATITVSVPSDYTDLQIRSSLRGTRAANIDGFEIYFNGDTGNNYGRICLYNEDGSHSGEVQKNGASTGNQIGGAPAASLDVYIYSQTTIDLLNYSGSRKKVFYSYHSAQRTGGATRNIWRTMGNWNNTSPITSVSFICFNASFAADSSVSIYGIRKA